MEVLKKFLRKRIPKLYYCLDETPTLEGATSGFTFKGWAFHSTSPTSIELEIHGNVVDVFHPIARRGDVYDRYQEIPNALFSGFEVNYPAEFSEIVF